jgi:hypothetical protein
VSRLTVFQVVGLICALLLMVYLGGDISGKWEALVPYSLALSFIGLIAFTSADRIKKKAEEANG